MSEAMAYTAIMIHNLDTLAREVPIEPDAQVARMMRLFAMDIPLLRKDLLELNEYRKKEAATNATSELRPLSRANEG